MRSLNQIGRYVQKPPGELYQVINLRTEIIRSFELYFLNPAAEQEYTNHVSTFVASRLIRLVVAP